jgi:hypothetical protein
MGQKTSKFQRPITAKDKDVGKFQSGIDNKKIKAGEIPVGGGRGSGYVDTRFCLSRESVVGHKQITTRDPEQHERDYFANNFMTSDPYTQQESESGDKARVIGVTYDHDRAIGAYPRDAGIVACLREACIDFTDFVLIPEQNIMLHATDTYGANSQYDGCGQNGALLQDKPIIHRFVENMEPNVPNELVTIN